MHFMLAPRVVMLRDYNIMFRSGCQVSLFHYFIVRARFARAWYNEIVV